MFDQVAALEPAAQAAFLNRHPDLAGIAQWRRFPRPSRLARPAPPRPGAPGQSAGHEWCLPRPIRHPVLLCARRHTRASLLAELARRLGNDPAAERQAALHEVFLITRLRLAEIVSGPGLPQVTAALSTHVFDTAKGQPGQGIAVSLFELDAAAPILLAQAVTAGNGHPDAPLLSGAPLRIGRYELRFEAGAYFTRAGLPRTVAPFLEEIPIRFAIAEPEADLHITLLLSPDAYTTYRGSRS